MPIRVIKEKSVDLDYCYCAAADTGSNSFLDLIPCSDAGSYTYPNCEADGNHTAALRCILSGGDTGSETVHFAHVPPTSGTENLLCHCGEGGSDTGYFGCWGTFSSYPPK